MDTITIIILVLIGITALLVVIAPDEYLLKLCSKKKEELNEDFIE